MGHRKGKCTTCGNQTGSSHVASCAKCYHGRGRVPGSTRSGQAVEGMAVEGERATLTRTVYEPITTLADLVRVCEIDTDEWEIVSWKANKWEAAAKDDRTGSLVTRPLFQVSATMRRRSGVVTARAALAALVADAKKACPRRPAPKRTIPQGEHMLEISIPDLHIGKLAWSEETLGANYDHKIAAGLYRDALDTLIARTAAFRFSRVVLPVGNDFFHSDTMAGTTTKGTPLDNDSRFQKTYVVGRRLLVEAVERLRQIAPVTVVVVPGNHDTLSTFCVGDSLECWYHNTPDVTVLNAPSPRKYLQHGKVMLLFTHGDKGKKDNLPLLMATEQPEMFGATVHREAHVGHTHQLEVRELMGVRVRVTSSLSAPDAWHSENHFVGNKRSAEALVWHPHEGLVSLATYTVSGDQAA